MAKAVYKHVGSFGKANRISTIGSQAHPRTGGAKEERGAEFSRAMKLESTGGVWPKKARGGWSTNALVHSFPRSVPEVKFTRKGEQEAESGSQIRQGRDRAEMACQDRGSPTSPSIICVIFH